MFSMGSKLTHSCGAPSTAYKSFDGRGYHVALRDIAQGELLTTSYLSWSQRLNPTPVRSAADCMRILTVRLGVRGLSAAAQWAHAFVVSAACWLPQDYAQACVSVTSAPVAWMLILTGALNVCKV
jgi:hypothetical protein